MKKNRHIYIMVAIAGLVLLLVARFVIISDELKMTAGIFYGFGAAFFTLGIGNLIGTLFILRIETDEIRRKKQIEMNDERNIRIKEKVGAKINHVVFYMINIMILAVSFMGIDFIVILMLLSILVTELVLLIVLTNHYSKTM